MRAPERFVRRVRPYLEDDEGVLASVTGREEDGRRRMAVIATDRRVLLVTLRPEPPIVIDYDGLDVELIEGVTCHVVFRTGLARYGVSQIADINAAELLVELVGQRLGSGHRVPERAPAFRIVS